jgi:hypothetical protein
MYGGSTAAGADAGWWLPYLAHRTTTIPPVNYGTELGPTPDYQQQVLDLAKAEIEKGITDPDVLEMARQEGISYVYIGQQQGKVNTDLMPLDPQALLADSRFHLVFQRDRTYVFEILP